MARILHENEWYEELSSKSHYESEFEAIIEEEAPRLFPEYRWLPFKLAVTSSEFADTRRADAALIHEDYRYWWVVEVELAHHDFFGHVLPQVRTLACASYGSREAKYLCGQAASLDENRVHDMLKGEPPQVLVIANAPVGGWAEHLRPYGAKVMTCQMFRSRMNRYVLRVNGDQPSLDDDVMTTCECDPLLHRLLVIHAPARLPIANGETVLLHHGEGASEWQRADTGGQVFLHALRDHNLVPGRRYDILQRSDDTLAIRTSPGRRS